MRIVPSPSWSDPVQRALAFRVGILDSSVCVTWAPKHRACRQQCVRRADPEPTARALRADAGDLRAPGVALAAYAAARPGGARARVRRADRRGDPDRAGHP